VAHSRRELGLVSCPEESSSSLATTRSPVGAENGVTASDQRLRGPPASRDGLQPKLHHHLLWPSESSLSLAGGVRELVRDARWCC
jgi:hypothetical protein